MFSQIFIKRPVFSIVCAIVITLAGLISIPTLPVEQYPNISPPQVVVTSSFVGATAQVVEETVTAVLERQINGAPGMRYMNSTSSNDGTSTIIVTFQQGYNQDIAAVDVQNRVALAEPQLPEAVRQIGVSVTRQSSAIALSIGLYSDQYDNVFLSNYADLYVLDTLRQIPGVGSLTPYGERKYAMRIWLDPIQLANRGLTAADVTQAIQEQNIQVGVGRIGQAPAIDQQFQIDLQAVGRLRDASEFENIILKSETNGTIVRLRDVGRAELGAESYNSFARYSGKEAVGYDIKQFPGSNALEVANRVKAEMKRLSKSFPPGLNYSIAYDPTLFIVASRNEVIQTLFESILLVILVIFIFLQDWRTMLIPALTIPITLIGTFAFVKIFNFSLNTLTLFGLTLAIGTVVDDAIVVVESITHSIQDEGLSPLDAAVKAMRELFGSVISGSLVLLAVFIPVAFFPGVTGQLYKQFALTIAFSVILSSFLAVTLIPALSALLLRPRQTSRGWLGRTLRLVNHGIEWIRAGYQRSLHLFTRLKYLVLALFVASLGITTWLYTSVPTAFLPDEDQGFLMSIVQGVEGTTQDFTGKTIQQLDQQTLKIPGVGSTFSLGGVGFSGNIANSGLSFVTLKPWEQRNDPNQSAQSILGQIQTSAAQIQEASVFAINPPAIQGLGSVGGFVFQLQDRGGNDLNTLVQARDELIARANKTPGLRDVFSTYTANAPQKLIEIDRDRAKTLQVEVNDILNTLQIFLGSRYVNDFNTLGRTYRVYVQADQQFRNNPDDIGKLYVRSRNGEMIPMSNLVIVTPTTGAQTISHYNLFRSIEINGMAAPGYSSGQAIQAMERLATEVLPRTMSFEWSGISLEEIESSGQAPIIFGLGLIFVFLILAAQYENFIDPLIILLSVPLAVLGALLAQSIRGFPNDVYCQIGLVMLIGLASKNAILIVEFANQLREEGESIREAAIHAAQARLRAILMTTFAGLMGNYPLLVASGAGSLSRLSLGTTVFGGTLVSMFLSLCVVPVLYILITAIRDQLPRYVRDFPKRLQRRFLFR
ncbi:efflux RND transporter permease subunit [Leptolyngbya sp. AN03gr2]|uniref:efflux RND transporter permease subunit n=1 Tax=unclassified Leptolyngbya TaxID=2650499 RepID=UPI003D321CDE